VSDDTLNSIGNFGEGDAVLYNQEALISGNGFIFKRLMAHSPDSKKIYPIFTEDEIKDGRLGAISPGYRLHIGLPGDGNSGVMNFTKLQDGQKSPLLGIKTGIESRILVGDLFEKIGEIDESNPPKRICRLMLLMQPR
jgi:hypothetical protein